MVEHKYVTLAACTVVAMASGSNYVFSAYAPQLASRLNISSTKLNLIGMAGNLGVYLSGPIFGKIIDAKGPRVPLISAFVLNFCGYAFIRLIYVSTTLFRIQSPVDPTKQSVSSAGLMVTIVAMFMTGMAGSAGLGCGMNTVAKSFSDKSRATATSITIAGYGLSAFLFSAASRVLFPGNTAAFLTLLALGTSIPMLIALLVVKQIPTEGHAPNAIDEGYAPISHEDYHSDRHSLESPMMETGSSRNRSLSPRKSFDLESVLARSVTRTSEDSALREIPGYDPDKEIVAGITPVTNIFGMALIKSLEFWLLASILVLLSGTGLMYINNVGSVVSALSSGGERTHDIDPILIGKYQAIQVSTISIWNCTGRIAMGMTSDFAKTRFKVHRIWFICYIALLFTLSQIGASHTTNLDHLWRISALLGFAYGNMFSLLPIVVLEWFGMGNFSSNWGIVSIAPGLGGNVANLLFGRIYDSHVVIKTTQIIDTALSLLRRGGMPISDHSHACLVGLECYQAAFNLTTIGCVIALGLGIYASVRHERQENAKGRQEDA